MLSSQEGSRTVSLGCCSWAGWEGVVADTMVDKIVQLLCCCHLTLKVTSHASKQHILEKCVVVFPSVLRFLRCYSVLASQVSTLTLLRGSLDAQVFI